MGICKSKSKRQCIICEEFIEFLDNDDLFLPLPIIKPIKKHHYKVQNNKYTKHNIYKIYKLESKKYNTNI